MPEPARGRYDGHGDRPEGLEFAEQVVTFPLEAAASDDVSPGVSRADDETTAEDHT